MYKIIGEIISMPRADSSYPHNFMVSFWVFKDVESESDAKTKISSMSALGWKSTLGMESSCTESALGTLCQHKEVSLLPRVLVHTLILFFF